MITTNLSQESDNRIKLKFIQDLSEEKKQLINSLEESLKQKLKEAKEINAAIDTSESKAILDTKHKILKETIKCSEDQNILAIEISMIDQAIQLEKNANSVTPETGNKMLKSKIADVENQIANTFMLIKLKEKLKENIKIQVNAKNLKKKSISINISYNVSRSITTNNTPKNKIDYSKSLITSPINHLISGRDNIIKLLNKGVDYRSSNKIRKALDTVGKDQQSFATKIVQLNRGVFNSNK